MELSPTQIRGMRSEWQPGNLLNLPIQVKFAMKKEAVDKVEAGGLPNWRLVRRRPPTPIRKGLIFLIHDHAAPVFT